MNKVSNYIKIDHDAERLAHDPALMDHVAHVLCLQGEMNIQFNSHHFVMHNDDVMAVPIQALVEEKKPSDDFRCICIYVAPELMSVPSTPPHMCLRGTMTIFKNPIMHVGAEKMKRLTADVEEIEKRMKCDDYLFQDSVLYHSIQIMMLDFFDIFARKNEERNVPFKHLEVMAKFMGMLYDETYVQHRRLEYYADKLNVTTKYLSDVSRTFTGRGASYWINRFTCTKICLLLKSTSMSFSEIADKFSFSSPSHFYVFFQKQMGMSPSEFRNKP